MTDAELRKRFPHESHRYFPPMRIGSTREMADEGAALILAGIKTTTSSALWQFPDGRIPFVGGLSVLLDGSDTPRAIVETRRVELKAFADVDPAFAHDYGEGERTLDWWRSVIGDWYRAEAARRDQTFDVGTKLVCEWFEVVVRV